MRIAKVMGLFVDCWWRAEAIRQRMSKVDPDNRITIVPDADEWIVGFEMPVTLTIEAVAERRNMDSSCRVGYTLSPEALSVLEILLPIDGRERFITSKEHLYFLLNLRRGYLGLEPMPAPRFQEIFHALISDPEYPKVSEVWSEDMKSRTLRLTPHGYSELRGSGRTQKKGEKWR